MQVGTTKDQGLYNKPSAPVHPGALAAGTLPQYNTMVLSVTDFTANPPVCVCIENRNSQRALKKNQKTGQHYNCKISYYLI